MASESNEKGKGISFTFFKKTKLLKLVPTNKEYANDNDESGSGKDFVRSAEGNRLQSLKPKEDTQELVIPCLPRNDVLFRHVKDGKADAFDKQAAEEILKDLSKAETRDSEKANNFSIPLLAKTHLVKPDESDESSSKRTAVSEESTLDDYDAVPVTQFGSAMLRGMGWKKGEAIGGSNKGLTAPIEFIPRSLGLGLGAERMHEENLKKKRRKPGDTESNERSGPIIEKDGKVRHFKSLDEKIPDQKVQVRTYSKGGYVVVTSGPHKDLSGKITALDEDNARVIVRLGINNEEVTVSQHNARLVDRDEYKQFLKERDKSDHGKKKRKRDEKESESKLDYNQRKHKSKHKKNSRDKVAAQSTARDKTGHKGSKESPEHCNLSESCWMAPLVRVRVISKNFKKGKYYHKKVVIQDVISKTICVCKTDEGRLLEDVPQSVLETVIPKVDPRFILFVQGKYRGLIGEIVQTESSKQQAIIQILRDKRVVESHYDDISEYVGDVHRE